jgi:hypothetical protein
MSLDVQVTSRYSDQYLRQLTNVDHPENSAVNSPLFLLACADVQGDFLRVIGKAYDETLSEHVAVAVEGVIAKLTIWGGAPNQVGYDLEDKFERKLRGLRGTILPKSTSAMVPSDETRLSSTPAPAFDDAAFDPFGPGPSPGLPNSG